MSIIDIVEITCSVLIKQRLPNILFSLNLVGMKWRSDDLKGENMSMVIRNKQGEKSEKLIKKKFGNHGNSKN